MNLISYAGPEGRTASHSRSGFEISEYPAILKTSNQIKPSFARKGRRGHAFTQNLGSVLKESRREPSLND
jgi:hypothetical protein